MAFLISSTVNLGRRTSKTRDEFLREARAKFDTYDSCVKDGDQIAEICPVESDKTSPNPMGGSVLCIKPTDKNRALDVGKGVHSMTGSESSRADEQLDRSPFGKGKEDE